MAGSFADAFVAKYDATGSTLVYSTFIGGGDFDQGTAIAVDGQGASYVAGNTNSANFPTVAPFQPRKDNDAYAFVAKIDPPGAALVYSTFVGGTAADGANAIAVDRGGNAHVVGTTGSGNWPTSKPVQGTKGGADDAFVLKLNAAGSGSLFSTFVGGKDADAAMGVAVDGQGGVHVLGLTSSSDFPSVKPVQGARPAAGGDAFVATLDLADATTPAPRTTVTPAAPSSTAHDRRVRTLGALTVALLLAAVLQTAYLRRRQPAPVSAGPGSRLPTPTPAASSGLTVLDDLGPAPTKTVAPTKGGEASKSTRTPKVRGGPKAPPAAAAAEAGAAASAAADVEAPLPTGAPDGGGAPIIATPPPPPRPRPQEPAIAQLLEEDLWGAEPAAKRPEAPRARADVESPLPQQNLEIRVEGQAEEQPPAPPPPPPPSQPAPSQPAPSQPAPSQPAPSQPVPSQPVPAIPPVPAEELSFWDLFPEDLPPARATAFPAEDLLADHLALPEGPDSAAGRLVGSHQPQHPPAEEEAPDRDAEGEPVRPPPPPEADIVIAELLDGPPPPGLQGSPDSPWAPQSSGDDFVVSDLLVEAGAEAGPERGDPQAGHQNGRGGGRGGSTDEQARIAADRARRRRSRRSGRRKPGSG